MAAGRYLEVEGLRLHYVEAGSGEPVLLLHGWPTSSYLWRGILGPLGESNRAIALDLPGFGRSDKPLDVSYDFEFFDRILTGFLAELGIDRVGMAVHDLGGPIGLHWAARHSERLTRLALLNTIVYARPSLGVVAFLAAARMPGLRSALTSPAGLRWAMRFGVHDKRRLSEEAIRAYQKPFETPEARRALQKAGVGLPLGGMREVERWLPQADVPVRIVYGERDRILTDVKRTMARAERDVGGAEVTALPDCSHFLQEERPAEIGEMLAEFFGRGGPRSTGARY
jgi:pimeloyl-ACP methyl ester carboxylesterase